MDVLSAQEQWRSHHGTSSHRWLAFPAGDQYLANIGGTPQLVAELAVLRQQHLTAVANLLNAVVENRKPAIDLSVHVGHPIQALIRATSFEIHAVDGATRRGDGVL